MFFTLLFAFIGLLWRGFFGLLWGGLIGYTLSRFVRAMVVGGLRKVQGNFIESTFAVVGALAKADGVVSPEEIRFVEGLFDDLHLAGPQREAAKSAFRRGKSPDFDLDAEVDAFGRMVRYNHALIQFFLMVQIRTVLADGEIHPSEQEMIARIARRLRLSEREVAQLVATLRSAANSRGAYESRGPVSAAAQQSRLDNAYAVLGVSASASEQELKKAYRKLMSEHHPDRLAAKGLPDSMRAMAEERSREINAAYELIKKQRGF